MNPRLVTFLRNEFRDKLHRKYPPIKFIEHVWKFTPKDLPRPVHPPLIRGDLINAYHRAAYTCKNGTPRVQNHGERGCYDPLQTICREILRQMGFPDTCFTIQAAGDRVVAGNFAELKPDFLVAILSEIADVHRNGAGAVAEIKEKPGHAAAAGHLHVDLSRLPLVSTSARNLAIGATCFCFVIVREGREWMWWSELSGHRWSCISCRQEGYWEKAQSR